MEGKEKLVVKIKEIQGILENRTLEVEGGDFVLLVDLLIDLLRFYSVSLPSRKRHSSELVNFDLLLRTVSSYSYSLFAFADE